MIADICRLVSFGYTKRTMIRDQSLSPDVLHSQAGHGAGWRGRVTFLRTTVDKLDSCMSSVYFEFEPGCLVEQSYLLRCSRLDDLQFRCPRALHFETLVAPQELLTMVEGSPAIWQFAGTGATLHISQSPDDSTNILEMFSLQRWSLILTVKDDYIYVGNSIYLMIVEQHPDFASRVGMVVVEESLKAFSSVNFERRRIRLL